MIKEWSSAKACDVFAIQSHLSLTGGQLCLSRIAIQAKPYMMFHLQRSQTTEKEFGFATWIGLKTQGNSGRLEYSSKICRANQ